MMHSPPPKQHHYAIEAAELLQECRENLRPIIGYLDNNDTKEQGGENATANANILDLDRTLLTTEQILHYHLLSLLEQERGYEQHNNHGTFHGTRSSGGGDGGGRCETHNHRRTYSSTPPRSSSDFEEPSAHSDLDVSNHTVTLEPIMETVDKLKSTMTQKHKRNRSMSFLQWHQKNEQEIEQLQPHQQQQQRDLRYSLQTKSYTKALKAARKTVAVSSSINSNHNINNNNDNDNKPFASFSSSQQSFTNSNPTTTTTTATRREKTAIDSVLFRLIVVLQLCLVRIEEAHNLLCRGGRKRQPRNRVFNWTKWGTATALIGASTYVLNQNKSLQTKVKSIDKEHQMSMLKTGTKALVISSSCLFLRRCWRMICMNARLLNTIFAIEDLHHQWMLVHSVQMNTDCESSEEQCQRLLKLIPFQRSNHSIWESEGAFRYGLIKWGMDLIYASVGTAIKVTKYSRKNKSSIMLPITAAAAASYYAITGASGKSAEFVSSSSASSDVISNAWGVVSLPAVKTLSLQASRLLKGAAIAERIRICGVSCFVLSKNPCTVLATAIKRYNRRQERGLSRLSIIPECEELSYSQRAINLNEYPKKDVIFHLTGGGFFAHTIAGDVPYLLDWSYATQAVVICPEYALLPEHAYPVAIEEVTRVYASLVNGNAAALLGFQTDRIIVTGESTGGNLATSLCVKLCLDGLVDVEELTAQKRLDQASEYTAGNLTPKSVSPAHSVDSDDSGDEESIQNLSMQGIIRLPDALMLCCPALNLSLELSPSRVLGVRDAVLPSSLISTISDAYVPQDSNISKSDPIVSPFYAPDEILRIFPPTLLYASSEDPLLDDSVYFNGRLRSNGVDSDLRAAQNVPHAYWGLGTAGFPEARKVQRECQQWMTKQLQAKKSEK